MKSYIYNVAQKIIDSVFSVAVHWKNVMNF